MDREEKLVKNFLLSKGFENIFYEPRGNYTTPDFTIENDIAIEVRRLNQYYESSKNIGLIFLLQ